MTDLLRLTAAQLNKLLRRDTLYCQPGKQGLLPPEIFKDSTDPEAARGPSPYTLEERAAARKAFLENRKTGPTTGLLPDVSFCTFRYPALTPMASLESVWDRKYPTNLKPA